MSEQVASRTPSTLSVVGDHYRSVGFDRTRPEPQFINVEASTQSSAYTSGSSVAFNLPSTENVLYDLGRSYIEFSIRATLSDGTNLAPGDNVDINEFGGINLVDNFSLEIAGYNFQTTDIQGAYHSALATYSNLETRAAGGYEDDNISTDRAASRTLDTENKADTDTDIKLIRNTALTNGKLAVIRCPLAVMSGCYEGDKLVPSIIPTSCNLRLTNNFVLAINANSSITAPIVTLSKIVLRVAYERVSAEVGREIRSLLTSEEGITTSRLLYNVSRLSDWPINTSDYSSTSENLSYVPLAYTVLFNRTDAVNGALKHFGLGNSPYVSDSPHLISHQEFVDDVLRNQYDGADGAVVDQRTYEDMVKAYGRAVTFTYYKYGAFYWPSGSFSAEPVKDSREISPSRNMKLRWVFKAVASGIPFAAQIRIIYYHRAALNMSLNRVTRII